MAAVGASGNAATRAEAFMYSKGSYAYGGYPDLDELFEQQAVERDRAKREALLHRIQQLSIERVMFAPIMDLRGLGGVGPRLAEHTINSIPVHPFPAWRMSRSRNSPPREKGMPCIMAFISQRAVRPPRRTMSTRWSSAVRRTGFIPS